MGNLLWGEEEVVGTLQFLRHRHLVPFEILHGTLDICLELVARIQDISELFCTGR